MTDIRRPRPVLVRLRDLSLDQAVPTELAAVLALGSADILRTGTVGFTALLTDAQCAAAAGHPLVAALEENSESLAPLHSMDQKPDVPDRYVVRTLRSVGSAADVVASVDLRTASVEITGMWFTATLTADQLNALRRVPGVDFISPAAMDHLA